MQAAPIMEHSSRKTRAQVHNSYYGSVCVADAYLDTAYGGQHRLKSINQITVFNSGSAVIPVVSRT